jgi:hypothetical protein
MRQQLRQQSKVFCAAGFDALVKGWDKCINGGGGYVEREMFFQVRISHVLHFISICDLFTDSLIVGMYVYNIYLITVLLCVRSQVLS